MNRRFLLEAGGLSLLLVFPFIAPLLVPGNLSLLHHRLTFEEKMGGILLDIAFFFLLGVGTCLLVQKMPKFPRSFVSGFLSGFVLWWTAFVIVNILLSRPGFTGETEFDQFLLAARGRVLQLNSLIPMVFAGIAIIRPKLISLLSRQILFGLAAFSFCGLWVLPQLLFIAYGLRPVGAFDHSDSVAKSSDDRRIVWILFDELSYKVAFESTPTGVELPNFHKLAHESSIFTNVQPPAYYTDRIVPAVLLGREVENVRSNASGKLLYRETSRGPWRTYDQESSVFGDASRLGWNPAIAGWYNPYCRMFEHVLTACSWNPGTPAMTPFERLGASRRKTVLQNAVLIPQFFMGLFTGFGGPQILNDQDRNAQDYGTLMGETRRLIQNEKLHFVFLHFPVPHPPGYYDRNRHAFCICGNYLDNVVLADDTLGTIMHDIEQSSAARKTTLIVSSDHSWRVRMWSSHPGFTAEEKEVSGGVYDPRPVFVVHLPGQAVPAQFTEPFSEIQERDILSLMLAGNIDNAEALAAGLGHIRAEDGK